MLFDTEDSLSLFNSRTKQSRYFIQSGGKGGKLFFNQVLHRGENTIIESKGDHIEIINAAFFTEMEFHVQEATFPVVIYGGYLKSGNILIACEQEEVSWEYLPEPYESYTDLKLNLDLFHLPGGVNYDPTLSVEQYNSNGLLVYPNPATDWLTLKTEAEIIEHVRIFDMQGRLVYQNQANESSLSIPVSEIGLKGLYSLQSIINGKRKTILISIL